MSKKAWFAVPKRKAGQSARTATSKRLATPLTERIKQARAKTSTHAKVRGASRQWFEHARRKKA